MRRALFLLCLVASPVGAADGTLFVVDRRSPHGDDSYVVRLVKSGNGWTFEKQARLPYSPTASYGFAFADPDVLYRSFLLRTVAFSVAAGQPPQRVSDWPNLDVEGVGAFAPNEGIGWQSSSAALVHLSEDGWQKVSADRFLGGPLDDVMVARTGRETVAVMGRVPPNRTAPVVADYPIFLVQLESNRQARVLSSGLVPNVGYGGLKVFSAQGVFYLADDATELRVRFVDYQNLTVAKPLHSLGVPQGTPVTLLGNLTVAGKFGVAVRVGNDLRFLPADGTVGATLEVGIFADRHLDTVLVPSGARASDLQIVAAQPVTGVDTTAYNVVFAGWHRSKSDAKSVLRGKLETRLTGIVGPLSKTLPALTLVRALNRDVMGTDWFVEILNGLPVDRRRDFYLDTRGGMYFVEPLPTATIDVAELVDALLASAKCSVVLGAP